MLCRHCHAQIGDHEKFCRYCGKSQQTLCPKCGTVLSDTARFCNACGTPLEPPKPVKAPKAKKHTPWGLIAVIAVLCIALIGGGFFAVKAFTEAKAQQQADRERLEALEEQLKDKESDKDSSNDPDSDKTSDTDDGTLPDYPPEPDVEVPEETPEEKPAPQLPSVAPALPYRPEVERPAVDFDNFFVGLVLPGLSYSGQSGEIYEGLCNNMAELGLEEDRIWVVEEFSDADNAYPACRELAAAGTNPVFIASPLTAEYELALAEEYPDTVFVVLGGTAAAISGLPNLVNAWPKTHEMWYIAGAAAGAQLLEDLETGAATEPFAAFFMKERTAQAISDYSAFYLGMKTFCPDAVLFTFQYENDLEELRNRLEEAAWGIGCTILAEHSPDNNLLPEVAMEIAENGMECTVISGNMEPLLMGYDPKGFFMELHWSWLLGNILWDYVDGEPMQADYTIGMTDGLFAWDSSLCQFAIDAAEQMTAKLYAGEPVFVTNEFTCYDPDDDSALLDNGEVVMLYVWDTDFDGVEDYENAVQRGMILEGELRSAPVFDLQIEGIEVMN